MEQEVEILKELRDSFQKIHKAHADFTAVEKEVAELRAQNRGFAEKFEALTKVNAELTENQKNYDASLKELESLRSQTESLRAEFLKGNRPASDGESPEAIQERAHQEAFVSAMRYGEKQISIEHQRKLSGTSDTHGGFLVPKAWNANVLMKAYNMAAIRPAATVTQTERDVIYPSISKPIVGWGTIDQKVTPLDLTTGQQELKLHHLVALIKINADILSDSQYDVWRVLSDGAARSIAEQEDAGFCIGDGVNKPSGLFVNTDIQANFVKTGVAAALSDGLAAATDGFTLIVNVMAKLKQAYKTNASWAFNSTTEGLMRLFHASVSKEPYLAIWSPPANVGQPATLMGKPILKTESAPDVAANAFPILFGDFSNYQIADKGGVTIKRLDELYMETNEVGFLVRKRVGGIPTLATEAWVSVKVAV